MSIVAQGSWRLGEHAPLLEAAFIGNYDIDLLMRTNLSCPTDPPVRTLEAAVQSQLFHQSQLLHQYAAASNQILAAHNIGQLVVNKPTCFKKLKEEATRGNPLQLSVMPKIMRADPPLKSKSLLPMSLWTRLPNDAQTRIIDILLSIPNTWAKNERMKISTLSAVSIGFRDSVSMFVNSPTGSAMQHLELHRIKRKIFGSDLSFIHESFNKEVRTQFGLARSSMDLSTLGYDDGIVEHVEASRNVKFSDWISEGIQARFESPSKFFSAVEVQYKRFMVIKAIESTHAATNAGAKRWHVRCQPTMIVDAFWHSHMLFPQNYFEFCQEIVGSIIDHEPGYLMPEADSETNANLKQKSADVFVTELKQLSGHANYQDNNLSMSASECIEDCYESAIQDLFGDEMGDCG